MNKADNSEHLRDYIFNAGFYNENDVTGPGAGTNRFVISASNNAIANPKNPARDPIAIGTTGWYIFQHRFYINDGALACDLSIYANDCLGQPINERTLGTPADLISDVGGVRYGWFAVNDFPEGWPSTPRC